MRYLAEDRTYASEPEVELNLDEIDIDALCTRADIIRRRADTTKLMRVRDLHMSSIKITRHIQRTER
jgi:hypothetical protein